MNAKRKGNQGEKELLNLFQEKGIDAHRNEQMYIGGLGNPDIEAIIGNTAYHVEVKRVERLNIGEAMRQAIRDCDIVHIPVVVHRKNREPWLITMRLDDFLQR